MATKKTNAKSGKTATKKTNAAPETKGFNTRTKEGRAKLDKAVLGKLAAKTGKTRGELATAVGADERAVSASLIRLESGGAARREGERPKTVWLKASTPSA